MKGLINKQSHKESFQQSYPFKIVEYQRLKHGIRVTDYSYKFLKMINYGNNSGVNIHKVKKAIKKLKQHKFKLYESLLYLWNKDISYFKCHRSTIYRRLNKALKLIALDIGILKPL